MDIISNDSNFDSLQLQLARVLVEDVINTLFDELEIDKETLVSVGRSVSFSIASILDGSRVISGEQRRLIPHIAFANSDNSSTLITSPDGSCMHEYVHGLVSELYGEFDSPVILNDELKQIPVRGLAVIAHRAIERGTQILTLAHGTNLPKIHTKMVDQLLTMLSDVAIFDGDSDKHTEILPWNLLKDYDAPLATLKFGSPERCLFLAAQEAARLNYRKVSGSLSFAAMVGDGDGAKWAKLQRMAESANYLDFRFVQSLIRESNQPTDQVIAIGQLGALWPNGEPQWTTYNPAT